MFGFLNRKPKTPALSGLLAEWLQAPTVVLQRHAQQRRAWPEQVVARLLEGLITQGSFVGALDALPGFESRAMPAGIHCLRHSGQLAGAILTDCSAALHFAQPGLGIFAETIAAPVLAAHLGQWPDWSSEDSTGMTAAIWLTPTLVLDVALAEGPVDPLFIGQTLPGVTLTLALRPAA